MNMKEVEAKCGLTRANIRYYEKEGLLAPVRRENGYRDYSEEDLKLLKRIRLLRELGISLEEIRQLKECPEQLKQVLERRLTDMEQEILGWNDAVTVCSEICFDGVSFYTMDTEYYLLRLEELYQERYQKSVENLNHAENIESAKNLNHAGNIENAKNLNHAENIENTRNSIELSRIAEKDREPVVPHPWKRYLARLLDMQLYQLLVVLLWYGLLGYFYDEGMFLEILILQLACIIVMLFMEPIFLTYWGTTPGKWVFGISIRDRDGQLLSYKNALIRVGMVIWKGLGGNIPVYRCYTLNRCHSECMDGEAMEWDIYLDTEYQIQEKKLWKIAVPAAISGVAFLGLTCWITWQQQIPRQPYCGELTAEEFVENYNWYVDQLGEMNSYYTGEHCYLEPDATYEGDPDSQNTPHLQWKEEDGILTEIYFTEQTYTNMGHGNYKQQAACAILAFGGDRLLTDGVYTEDFSETNFLAFPGGQKELTLWNLKMGYLMGLLDWKNSDSSCEFTVDGIHVKYEVFVDGTKQGASADDRKQQNFDIELTPDDEWHDIKIIFLVENVQKS